MTIAYKATAWGFGWLWGLTPANGQDNILIGQGVQASLATDAPVSFSNYSWSTNDTYTFASFDMASDQTWSHMTACNPAIWSSATPSWFWYVEGDGTVTSSATANVTATGQNLGTVNANRPV